MNTIIPFQLFDANVSSIIEAECSLVIISLGMGIAHFSNHKWNFRNALKN